MLIKDLPTQSYRKKRTKKIRGFIRKVYSACNKDKNYPNIRKGDWCNHSHLHLDWHGYGDFSRKARQIFIKEYAQQFKYSIKTLITQDLKFQIFIIIHPYDSSADCIYIHTPNPHSEFPITLSDVQWGSQSVSNIFTSLLPEFKIIEGFSKDGQTLFYYADGIGIPPR